MWTSESSRAACRARRLLAPGAALASLLACGLWAASPLAATLSLANVPLQTSISTAVKPNLMYIMDTSGSLAWSFMPDSVGNSESYNCFKNYQYNGVYYNPNYTYQVPMTSAGVAFAASSFTAAPYDGYSSFDKGTATSTNLSTSFQAYDSTTGNSGSSDNKQPAYYYLYTPTAAQLKAGAPAVPDATTCSNTGNGYYTKVLVSATSGPGGTDERANFANWYTYYRTRILFVKSAIGIALSEVNSNYRLGFTNIYNTSWGGANSGYLPIGDLTATQKSSFYSTLYSQVPNGDTPLQAALYAVGQLFQKKLSGAPDPIQYSCQKNFALLSTDGYWNASFNAVGDTDGTTSQVNGASVSTQRPFFDGGYSASSNTLADVAYYFWATDLRPAGATGALGTDVSANNVSPTPTDPATWQHMDLFTIGLGANGVMTYIPNYATATSGSYYNILTGAVGACPGYNSGSTICNWPVPTSNQNTTIDDLWHAAVNGHGTYYSVKNAGQLADGLSDVLNNINAATGAGAAAATSNPNVVTGNDYLFETTYTSDYWYGDVYRQTISTNNGSVVSTDWDAQALLDAAGSATADTRTIFMGSGATPTPTGSGLTPFLYSNMSSAQQAFFSAAKLSQFATFLPAQQAAATGASLVNYLRGQRGNEINSAATTASTSLYRPRLHLLGDIVNSQAAYVQAPVFNYSDTGYAAFVAANSNRQGMVYVGANDGMLHAFNSSTGTEVWAFIPSLMLPNLYLLADAQYSTLHQYFVDGSPSVGDIYYNGSWHTILVGGFNAGGRGYYCLDITNPSTPSLLWEFSAQSLGYSSGNNPVDPNLGYTFGNPVITKNAAGNWVVLVSSGYNNVSPGDGAGHLYELNAYTGAIGVNLSTGVGSTTTPSGLGRINAWVANTALNNTMLRVYGGDLQGNLWRFDPDTVANGDGLGTLFLLATLKDPSGVAQPITTKPELGQVGTTNPVAMVYVATGQYLAVNDVTATQVQTVYGIKDPLTPGATAGWGNVRNNTSFVQQTLTYTTSPSGAEQRLASSNPVNLATVNNGWYVDLPDSGERVNTDPSLDLGILSFTSNVPNADACTAGGYSYLNYLDYSNGAALAGSNGVSGVFLGNEIATTPVVVELPSGKLVSIVRGSAGDTFINGLPTAAAQPLGTHMNWREILGM